MKIRHRNDAQNILTPPRPWVNKECKSTETPKFSVSSQVLSRINKSSLNKEIDLIKKKKFTAP